MDRNTERKLMKQAVALGESGDVAHMDALIEMLSLPSLRCAVWRCLRWGNLPDWTTVR